jgi:hypothetical protein
MLSEDQGQGEAAASHGFIDSDKLGPTDRVAAEMKRDDLAPASGVGQQAHGLFGPGVVPIRCGVFEAPKLVAQGIKDGLHDRILIPSSS